MERITAVVVPLLWVTRIRFDENVVVPVRFATDIISVFDAMVQVVWIQILWLGVSTIISPAKRLVSWQAIDVPPVAHQKTDSVSRDRPRMRMELTWWQD